MNIIELQVCQDCILIIANDDDSGIENAEAHRDAMAARSAGVYLGPGGNDEYNQDFTFFRCDTCGSDAAGESFAAFADQP